MATLGPAALTALRMDGAPGLAQVPDIVVDAGGAWKLFLARDLRRAGIQLDISRAAADLWEHGGPDMAPKHPALGAPRRSRDAPRYPRGL